MLQTQIKRLTRTVKAINHKIQWKAFLKRWVFKLRLKASVVCGALRWSGRAFHSLGAAEVKTRLFLFAWPDLASDYGYGNY